MLSVLKQEVTWSVHNKKEVEEAKTLFRKAKTEGRKILNHQGFQVEHFSPFFQGFTIEEAELIAGQMMTRIVNETGDEIIVWNSQNLKEVKEAFEKFNSYIERGWKAYGVRRDGGRGMRIHKFDAEREEIVFDEQTTCKSLQAFVESFKKVEILPRTYPG